LSVPLPIIDRNRVARATAIADVLAAEARLTRVRADVRRNIIDAQARLAAAIDAVNAAAEIPQIIERESSSWTKRCAQVASSSPHLRNKRIDSWKSVVCMTTPCSPVAAHARPGYGSRCVDRSASTAVRGCRSPSRLIDSPR
jgi:hypothetical protein